MRRAYVKLSFIAASVVALVASACQTAQANPAWYRAETKHFVVYSDASEASTREYLSKLESFYVTASSFYITVSDGVIDYKQKPVYLYIKTLEDDYAVFPQMKVYSTSEGGRFELNGSCTDGETNAYTDADFMTGNYGGDYRFLAPNLFLKRVYMSKGLPAWVSAGMYSYVLNADIQRDKIVVGNPSFWQTLDPAHTNTVEFLDHHVPFSEIIADNITSTKYRASLPAQYWLMMDYMLSTPENRHKLSRYAELVAGGRPSAAAFQEAIGIDPTFFDQLIKTYNKSGFPVIEYKVSALDPKEFQLDKLPDYGEPVPLLSAAAQACPGLQYTDEIIGRLQKVASARPDDRYVQRELARSQILLGQAANAKAYIEAESTGSATDYDFKYLEGRYYLALAEGGTGAERAANYQKARLSLGKAYQLSETSGPVLYYYARAFEEQPDFPNANTLTALRQADELMPDAGYKYYLNALLIKTGHIVEEYTQSIDEKPTVSDYISRAFYRPDSEYKEKLADLAAAIQLGPDSDLPYIARSAVYLKHDDTAAALDDANKAVDLSPTDFLALDARAVVYLQMSKPDLALKDLDKSVYQNQNAAALNGVCWTLATHGAADKAVVYCNRAIAQSPNYANAFDSRAFAEMRLNQLDVAVADYTRALGLNPDLSASWYGRGLAKIKQGKADEGNRDQERAKFIDPAVETEFARYEASSGE